MSIEMLFSHPNPDVELRFCPPSPFVRQHQQQLFPTWNQPVASTLVVLQKSRFPLTQAHPELELEKERLRERFLRWAFPWVCQVRDRLNPDNREDVGSPKQSDRILTDLVDPRSGYPLFSRPGEIRHDDVAAASWGLGWEIVAVGECRAMVHPQWGTAVYPATVLSTASPGVLQSFLDTDPVELR